MKFKIIFMILALFTNVAWADECDTRCELKEVGIQVDVDNFSIEEILRPLKREILSAKDDFPRIVLAMGIDELKYDYKTQTLYILYVDYNKNFSEELKNLKDVLRYSKSLGRGIHISLGYKSIFWTHCKEVLDKNKELIESYRDYNFELTCDVKYGFDSKKNMVHISMSRNNSQKVHAVLEEAKLHNQ